jgi:hypothetical protein
MKIRRTHKKITFGQKYVSFVDIFDFFISENSAKASFFSQKRISFRNARCQNLIFEIQLKP